MSKGSKYHTAAYGVGARSQAEFRAAVLAKDGYRCQNCGKLGPANLLEAHHVIWLSNSGEHNVDNGQCLCKDCHFAVHRPAVSPERQEWVDLLRSRLSD